MKIKTREQGIVVEHFFEVRHKPFRIGGVTMETATELIVDPALGHLLTRVTSDLECIAIGIAIQGANVCAQEKLQRHRRRKLWRTAEAAVYGIIVSDDACV